MIKDFYTNSLITQIQNQINVKRSVLMKDSYIVQMPIFQVDTVAKRVKNVQELSIVLMIIRERHQCLTIWFARMKLHVNQKSYIRNTMVRFSRDKLISILTVL